MQSSSIARESWIEQYECPPDVWPGVRRLAKSEQGLAGELFAYDPCTVS
ncbi:MAG TPA: hypothetical protein VFO16_24630 [Pseudonocardiaceae bacterium]|nr:hypothetical protein [Pseudonocardiaceae bacterium]